MGSVSSDSSLDDIIVDDAWKTELEIALLGMFNFQNAVYSSNIELLFPEKGVHILILK